MANKNCLVGIRCPQCKQNARFLISVYCWCVVTDDGTEDVKEVEWDKDASIKCVQCDHAGTVRQFSKPPRKKRRGTPRRPHER